MYSDESVAKTLIFFLSLTVDTFRQRNAPLLGARKITLSLLVLSILLLRLLVLNAFHLLRLGLSLILALNRLCHILLKILTQH